MLQQTSHLAFNSFFANQVGGFAHGKSYATDVAEILARSGASVHPSHLRGLPLASSDARRSALPGFGAVDDDRIQDDDWNAGAHAEYQQPFAPHHFVPSPQPLQPSDRSIQMAPPSYPQKLSTAKFPAPHQISGNGPDANISADQIPAKKAWELEVERLRMAMQQQQVSGARLLL